VTFKTATKNIFSYLSLYAYSFLKAHFHHSSEIKKVIKKPQTRRNQGFSSAFCFLMEGSESLKINYGIRIQEAQHKNIRIRFRLRYTVQKNVKNERELYFDEDNEVEVVPHVVLVADMLFKGHVLVVESLQNKC
jgi:hypothetical protein